MKAEWSNKDSLEMPTTTTSDYIKREDAMTCKISITALRAVRPNDYCSLGAYEDGEE